MVEVVLLKVILGVHLALLHKDLAIEFHQHLNLIIVLARHASLLERFRRDFQYLVEHALTVLAFDISLLMSLTENAKVVD